MSGDRLDLLDYYTLLGVADDATADAIRDAYRAFALRFHPDRHVGAAGETVSRAEEIFRRGAEAYRVLLDPDARPLYDEALRGGRLRLDPEEEGVRRHSSIPIGTLGSRSTKARPFIQKAEQAMRKGDLTTARLNLRIALSHDAGNTGLAKKLADVEAKLKKK